MWSVPAETLEGFYPDEVAVGTDAGGEVFLTCDGTVERVDCEAVPVAVPSAFEMRGRKPNPDTQV